MALYWFDSFANYQLDNSNQGPWDVTQYASIVNEPGSNRWGSGSSPGLGWLSYIGGGIAGGSVKRMQVNRTNSTMGFACNFGGNSGRIPTGTNWMTMCGFMDSSFATTWNDVLQVQLQMSATGALRVARGSSVTVLATSTTTPLQAAGWHYVEFYALINSTTGAFTVRVDGVVVSGLTLTGQNTQASTNAQLNGFFLAGCPANSGTPPGVNDNGGQFYANDLYVLDASGSAPQNTFLGDVKCIYSPLNGSGGVNQFTQQATPWAASTAKSRYAVIIDTNGHLQKATTAGTTGGSPPASWATTVGNTTADGSVVWTCFGTPSSYMYVNSPWSADAQSLLSDQTVGDTELYTIGALAGVPAGVTTAFAVGMDIRGARDQTTTRAVRTLVKSGGTQVDNGTDLTLQNGIYVPSIKTLQPVDPNSGGIWTITAINNALYGFKVSV